MILRCLFVPIMLMLLLAVNATAQDALRRDAKGRYIYEHTSHAPGASKSEIYARMKAFVIEDLNASDTRINWDEGGQDSIVTIAYIELDNGPELVNQLVDCKAKLYFREEQVTLYLSSFNYHGKLAGSDTDYARPLHRMSPVPYTAQSYAMTLLTVTLQQLSDRMDLAAVGRDGGRRARAKAEGRR